MEFVRLRHYGHELYYHARQQLLLLQNEEVRYYAITSARMFAKPVRYPVAKESQLAVSQSSLLAEEPLRIKNQAMNLKAQIETILLLVKAGTQQEAEAMEAFTRTLMQGMPGFLVA